MRITGNFGCSGGLGQYLEEAWSEVGGTDMTRLVLVSAAVCWMAASAYGGPVFEEPPGDDAGDTLSTASAVSTANGAGVTSVKGELKGDSPLVSGTADFVDLYQIFIEGPAQFSAEMMMLDGGNVLGDPCLYLLDSQGRGLVAMNDRNGDNTLPRLTAGNGSGGFLFEGSGIFYLAVTSAPVEMLVSLQGEQLFPVFEMGLEENQVGPVFANPEWAGGELASWTPPVDAENVGRYEILLTGVGSIPAPGGLAALALLGIVRTRRRR